MNQHQHSLPCSDTRHVGHDKKVLQMTTNHSASRAPASTVPKSPFSLFLWTAVAFIIRLAYIYCNHLFAGLIQSLASSGCAATTKTIEVCASSASHATTTARATAGAAKTAVVDAASSAASNIRDASTCTFLNRFLTRALVLLIFQARGTREHGAALSLPMENTTSVNFLNFLQTTSSHAADGMLMCGSDGKISHDMPRLIPDGILTEGIHGNTVEIPSSQQVRPQGILSFTIKQHQEVSIIYYI